MTTATFLGGPQHGETHTVPDDTGSEIRTHTRPDFAELAFGDAMASRGTEHRYRIARYARRGWDGRAHHFEFYVYQGPWVSSQIAGFLYQRLVEGRHIERGPVLDSREAKEIRRHEEYATGLTEPRPRSHDTSEASERWLRTQAAVHADRDGYKEEWAV